MENNWTIEQTKSLFRRVKQAADEGKGLRHAFEKTAAEAKRSVNSVRNYYYSQLKMFELVPSLAADLGIETIKARRDGFSLFNDDEITRLVQTVLIAKARGQSVRASIAAMSCNSKEALRLQNKYRSMIAHHRQRVLAIMNGLSERGEVYFNPYLKQVVDGQAKSDNLSKLNEYISKLDAGEVGNFLSLLSKLNLS